ncbi:MAG: ribosome-associated translation inhibitor RaiA [Rhodanobacteraceae bacterium]
MQIHITGHQIEVTAALRQHVEEKIVKFPRLFDNLTSFNVVLAVEKLEHKAEGTLAASGRVLHAVDVKSDMYASIDGMVDKLVAQLRKHKEKLKDHHQAEARQERYG